MGKKCAGTGGMGNIFGTRAKNLLLCFRVICMKYSLLVDDTQNVQIQLMCRPTTRSVPFKAQIDK